MSDLSALAYFAQQSINAVPVAALYGLLAHAYGLTFGLTRRPDFTPGALFALSGQIFVMFAVFGWDQWILVLPAAIALGAGAALVYTLGVAGLVARHIASPLGDRRPDAILIASLGLMIVLMEAVRIAAHAHEPWLQPFWQTPLVLWEAPGFPVTVTVMKIVVAGGCLLLVIVAEMVMAHSFAGLAWRAVVEDRLAAGLMGIDVGRVRMTSWLCAALLVCCGGILATAHYGSMDFGAGFTFGLKVIMIAAIGASRSPRHAALAGFGYGVVESLWSSYAPQVWRDVVLYGLLVVLAVGAGRNRRV